MRIRTYQSTDEDAVLTLWTAAGIDRPWLDMRAEIAEKRRRDRPLFLVADDSGIIGSVMGAYDGRRGWAYHLAVLPDRQGLGIGTS